MLLIFFADQNSTGPSLIKVLVKCYGPYYLVGSAAKLIHDILNFTSPQLLRLVAKSYFGNLILRHQSVRFAFDVVNLFWVNNAWWAVASLSNELVIHKFRYSSIPNQWCCARQLVVNFALIYFFLFYFRGLIQFTQQRVAFAWQGYLLAVLLFVVAVLQTFAFQKYMYVCFQTGMRMVSGLTAAVYRKVS